MNNFLNSNIDIFDEYSTFPQKYRVMLEERKELLHNYNEKLKEKYQKKCCDSYNELIKTLTQEEVNELSSIIDEKWIEQFKKVDFCDN